MKSKDRGKAGKPAKHAMKAPAAAKPQDEVKVMAKERPQGGRK